MKYCWVLLLLTTFAFAEEVIDHHGESKAYHVFLHDFFAPEEEKEFLNNDEMTQVMDTIKSRFHDHECLGKLNLSNIESHNGDNTQWVEELFVEFSRHLMFALVSEPPCPQYQNMSHGEICAADLAKILHGILLHYDPAEDYNECFNDFSITGNGCLESDEVNVLLLSELYAGHCILPTETQLLGILEEALNITDENIISKTEFEKLLAKLGIAEQVHGPDEDEHAPENDHGHGEEEDHEDDHEDHDDHEEHFHKMKRQADDHDHEHAQNVCLGDRGFYDLFRVRNNITWVTFKEMAPIMIQQIYTDACVHHEDPVNETITDSTYTRAKKYGYGTLSVILISLLALVGLLLIPVMGKFAYEAVMQFFVALGISSLFSDALLHIMPFVLGLHVHGAGDDHDHDEEEEDITYIWKLSVTILGVYVFFLLECILIKWHSLRNMAKINEPTDMAHSHRIKRFPVNSEADETKPIEAKEKTIKFLGLTPLCLMIFIGDILHNFGDGIAIGVAFGTSVSAGIGTSLAIFCHELPHEFGDFAIYLQSGASKKKAIILNVVAAFCALFGLYLGLGLSGNTEVRQWLLSIIAGMFIYISLVDVLHEVIEAIPSRSLWIFLIQNIGLIIGWVALLLLALYEEDLESAVN